MSEMKCSVDGCESSVLTKSFCSMHYTRFRKHGDPLIRKIASKYETSCSVESCNKKAYCKSFCTTHYLRWRAHGDPINTPHTNKDDPLSERLRKKINKNGECWEWTGNRNTLGYGVITINKKSCLAHRMVYEIEHGKIEDSKLEVMHKCDNPPCCRIDHLILGTHKENIQDAINKGRMPQNIKRGI